MMRWKRARGKEEVWICKDGPVTYATVRKDLDGKWLAEVAGSVVDKRFDTPGQAQHEASWRVAGVAERVMRAYWAVTICAAVLLVVSLTLQSAFGWTWIEPVAWLFGAILGLCLAALLL